MDEPTEPPSFDYAALMRQSILDVVRRVMARVADEGFPGEHHFYLTFATAAEGVEVPPRQRQQFPDEMTIVLQHQFWNLAVDDSGFGVTLRFAGKPERLRVPWTALRVFADPSVGFALKLPSSEAAPAAGPEIAPTPRNVSAAAAPAAPAKRPETASEGKVVHIGSFRRRPDTESER